MSLTEMHPSVAIFNSILIWTASVWSSLQCSVLKRVTSKLIHIKEGLNKPVFRSCMLFLSLSKSQAELLTTGDLKKPERKGGGPGERQELSLRRNPPEVRVTSRQKPCTKIIYIVLKTSVGPFSISSKNNSFLTTPNVENEC